MRKEGDLEEEKGGVCFRWGRWSDREAGKAGAFLPSPPTKATGVGTSILLSPIPFKRFWHGLGRGSRVTFFFTAGSEATSVDIQIPLGPFVSPGLNRDSFQLIKIYIN